jgi:hypothetical protein
VWDKETVQSALGFGRELLQTDTTAVRIHQSTLQTISAFMTLP